VSNDDGSQVVIKASQFEVLIVGNTQYSGLNAIGHLKADLGL
jgi:hypothetical protein